MMISIMKIYFKKVYIKNKWVQVLIKENYIKNKNINKFHKLYLIIIKH